MGAEIKLSDGRVVNVTAYKKMTVPEYRAFIGNSNKPEDDDAIVCKYTGLTPEELETITQTDYRTLVFAIVREANRHDPNSQSASTSP